MSTWIRGDKLSRHARNEVECAFVHRIYDSRYSSFEEWLAAKEFGVTKSGRLSRKHRYCRGADLANDSIDALAAELRGTLIDSTFD
jgi:hypothetical protein